MKSRGLALPVPLYQAKAELFRTLGHPVRIRLLELLCEGDHAVHELRAKVAAEPSAVSQQLGILRRAGLVRQQRIGGEVVYALMVPEVRDLLAAARTTLSVLLAGQTQLHAALEEEVSIMDGASA